MRFQNVLLLIYSRLLRFVFERMLMMLEAVMFLEIASSCGAHGAP